MYRKLSWFIGVVAATGLLVLSACSRATPTPEMLTPTTEQTAAPTAAPEMTAETQPALSETITASPYPYPIEVATQPSVDVYPNPTSEQNQAGAPVLSPTATDQNSADNSTSESAANPYPVPATPNPTPAATARPTRVPNQDPVATDPSQVQLASGKIQLVEFFAFWDGASKSMAPMLNAMADEYDGKMNFIFLDVDDPANQKFKDALNYRIQPQFFLLDKQGGIIKQWQGYVDEAELRDAIDGALK